MGWIYNKSDDTPTWGPQIVAIAVAFTAVSFTACCLRIYVRLFLIKAFGAGESTPILGQGHPFLFELTR